MKSDNIFREKMASSLNRVTLIGNLGKDPEVRVIPGSGTKVASFTIATTETRRNKTTGEREDKPEWHRIVVFNERLVDLVEKYIRKGSKLYIEGQLQTRSWIDKSGNERYVTEVVLGKYKGDIIMLDSKKDVAPLSNNNEPSKDSAPISSNDDYDEVPF